MSLVDSTFNSNQISENKEILDEDPLNHVNTELKTRNSSTNEKVNENDINPNKKEDFQNLHSPTKENVLVKYNSLTLEA